MLTWQNVIKLMWKRKWKKNILPTYAIKSYYAKQMKIWWKYVWSVTGFCLIGRGEKQFTDEEIVTENLYKVCIVFLAIKEM